VLTFNKSFFLHSMFFYVQNSTILIIMNE
jgi:hypothetical protein